MWLPDYIVKQHNAGQARCVVFICYSLLLNMYVNTIIKVIAIIDTATRAEKSIITN